ncbi:MAG: hypothetical protein Q9220_002495 [cf. Caloplaca sp. 1 TL-2023]
MGLPSQPVNPPILMINESNSDSLSAVNYGEPHSFGIALHVGGIPILAQATGGILTQAMYKAFLQLGPEPLTAANTFQHDYSETVTSRVCFDVQLTVTALESMKGIYMLTNRRVATVLSLMGFDFSHQDDLNALKEYSFDVLVETEAGATIIGHGFIKNTQPALRPSLLSGSLVVPRCIGTASAARSINVKASRR